MNGGYLIQKPDGRFIAFFNARDWTEACDDYRLQGFNVVCTGKNSRSVVVSK